MKPSGQRKRTQRRAALILCADGLTKGRVAQPAHARCNLEPHNRDPIIRNILRTYGLNMRSVTDKQVEFSEDRLCVLGRQKDRPHGDRARGPAEPAATACSCRAACPSHRSRATPVRRSEPGSSPLQDRDHPRQRRPVDRPIDNHPPATRQHDLHPARRRRTRRHRIVGWRVHRRRARLGAGLCSHDHRHKPAGPGIARRLAKQPPPPEYLIGVDVVALGDHRHRNPRLMGLRHDLTLLRLAPPPPAAANRPATLCARMLLGIRHQLDIMD